MVVVVEVHTITTATGVDRGFAVTTGPVRDRGRWAVAIDDVHPVPLS